MKEKIIDIYKKSVITTAIVFATVIVMLTSPVWAFVCVVFHSSEIIKDIEEWMKIK